MSGACAIHNCVLNLKELDTIIPLYKFPKDKELRQKWVDCCMRPTPPVDPDTEEICMLHFEKKDIICTYKTVPITPPLNEDSSEADKISWRDFENKYLYHTPKEVTARNFELKDDAFPKQFIPLSEDIPWLRCRNPEIILKSELEGEPKGYFKELKEGIKAALLLETDMAGRQEQISLAKSLDFLMGPEDQEPWHDNYNIKTESSKSPNSDNDLCIEEHSIDDPIHNDGYKIEELSSTHRDQSSQQDVVMGARNSEEEEVMTYQVLTGRQQDVTGRDHTPTTQSSTSTGASRPSTSHGELNLLDVPCPRYTGMIAHRLLTQDPINPNPVSAISAAAMDHNASLYNLDGLYGNTHDAPALTRPEEAASATHTRHSTVSPHTAPSDPYQYTSVPLTSPHLLSPLATAPPPYQPHVGFYNNTPNYSMLTFPRPPVTSHQVNAFGETRNSMISPPGPSTSTQLQYSPSEHLVSSSSGSPTEPQNLSRVPPGEQRGENGKFASLLTNIQRDRTRSGSPLSQPGPSSRVSSPRYNSPRRNERNASSGSNGSFQSFNSSTRSHPYYVPTSVHTPQGSYSYSADPGFSQYLPQGYYSSVTPAPPQTSHQQGSLAVNQPGGSNMTTDSTYQGSQLLPSFPTFPPASMPPPQAEGEGCSTNPSPGQIIPASGMRVRYQPRYSPRTEALAAEAMKRELGVGIREPFPGIREPFPGIREPFPEFNGAPLGIPPLHPSRDLAGPNNINTNNNILPRQRGYVSDRDSTCGICEVTFASSGHLKRHLQSHGSGRRFKCSFCSCAYSRQDNLRKHIANAHKRAEQQQQQPQQQPQPLPQQQRPPPPPPPQPQIQQQQNHLSSPA